MEIETAKISTDEFEKLLEEQKSIMSWSNLDEGSIYEIVDFKNINTVHGESCVITLSDDTEVFATSAVIQTAQL